jgi:hypothetical protein
MVYRPSGRHFRAGDDVARNLPFLGVRGEGSSAAAAVIRRFYDLNETIKGDSHGTSIEI